MILVGVLSQIIRWRKAPIAWAAQGDILWWGNMHKERKKTMSVPSHSIPLPPLLGEKYWQVRNILGWVLPYLGMVWRSAVMTPFYRFPIRLGPYFISPHDPIDPLFLQKRIGLSLSHLVPEILGPKVGKIFHQNVLFNRF